MMARRPIATRLSLTGFGTMGDTLRRSPPHCLRRLFECFFCCLRDCRDGSCTGPAGGETQGAVSVPRCSPSGAPPYRSGTVILLIENGPPLPKPPRAEAIYCPLRYQPVRSCAGGDICPLNRRGDAL